MLISQEQYYVAPSQEIFDSIKRGAISLWKTFDDEFGYATGKVNRIAEIQNVKDNYAYMVAMFDNGNQHRLMEIVDRADARDLISSLIETNLSYL